MDSKLTSIADRLNAKLKGLKNQELGHDDNSLIELVDAHLDLVSAAHGSCHGSCHPSNLCDTYPYSQSAQAAPPASSSPSSTK
jgi:hypothetical protein